MASCSQQSLYRGLNGPYIRDRMSNATFHVRRATVDDLPNLLVLWGSMHFPTADLEPRLTEFQIVESEEGELLGALGIQIVERHARLHSEAFNDFTLADQMREQLWERMQSVAANHGLARLWTSEAAPFWKYNGFRSPDADEFKRLPPAWSIVEGDWLTLRLRDEDALRASLEMDLEPLKQAERQKGQWLLSNMTAINFVAWALVGAVIIAAIVLCIGLLKYLPRLRGY